MDIFLFLHQTHNAEDKIASMRDVIEVCRRSTRFQLGKIIKVAW